MDRDLDKIKEILKWEKPHEDELKDWLINQKEFAENKVESGIKRLVSSVEKKPQARLDLFFKSAGTTSSSMMLK